MKRTVILIIALAVSGIMPWLLLEAPSFRVSGCMVVITALGWWAMWLLDKAQVKRDKCTEEPTNTCYQVQAADLPRLLPNYYDGEGEWSMAQESGRISHTLADAHRASKEALTCLPEGADDAIVVEVWCDCRR